MKAEKIGKAGNGAKVHGLIGGGEMGRKQEMILKECLGLDHRFLGDQAGSLHFLLKQWGATENTQVGRL